ncbi:hypothetical protein [Rhodospirillum centenum]|uniref:Uncharacterized protein n=1 Tax=Rhodospirillum centenum (strain ATCC 51521 / SW) TaxID=414684 RepID=B6IU57_RHOCS|nr:hypothetical protein [Rhodospirillum centenum]ACI99934.1 hypothetical protein RC1_2554 [Rhodospirillum centenum SW]
MEFVNYKDSAGREVWLNPRLVSLIVALGDAACRVHLGADGHTVDLRAAAAEVAKGVAAAAEPPPPPDPTMNLLS